MQKITPFLWFDGKAEDAAQFYTSIFKDSKITKVTRSGGAGPGPKGSVMSVVFQLEGQEFFALNGGPHFTFSPAVSFFVNFETQGDGDALWEKLSACGEKQRCGLANDKFRVARQGIPSTLGRLLQDEDATKSRAVMQAMMQMEKIDIAGLERAHEHA